MILVQHQSIIAFQHTVGSISVKIPGDNAYTALWDPLKWKSIASKFKAQKNNFIEEIIFRVFGKSVSVSIDPTHNTLQILDDQGAVSPITFQYYIVSPQVLPKQNSGIRIPIEYSEGARKYPWIRVIDGEHLLKIFPLQLVQLLGGNIQSITVPTAIG